MKTLFPIIICISTSVCWVDDGHAGDIVQQPPERFAGKPRMLLSDNIVSLPDVQVYCKEMGAVVPPNVPYLLGCSKHTHWECTIYRINDESVKRHEWAHCSGWPGNHPTEAELQQADANPAPPWPPIEYLRKKYGVEDNCLDYCPYGAMGCLRR